MSKCLKTLNFDSGKHTEWLRGKVIRNQFFFRLCPFEKVEYIENNILNYLKSLVKNFETY